MALVVSGVSYLRKGKKVYVIFLVVDLFCYLCRIIYNILLTC